MELVASLVAVAALRPGDLLKRSEAVAGAEAGLVSAVDVAEAVEHGSVGVGSGVGH
jgi:hypothetical protein